MHLPLDDLLDLARATALRAGAMLRDEFHREGGPRHTSPHDAWIDAEAERLIRDLLLARTPEFAYLGEELGPAGQTPGPGTPLWLIDPNDGTSDFIRGYRGPSVSIALVRDGEPLLGVVYAYSAPDDDGDLLEAVAGGPLRRNGRIVERDWPEEASEGCVLLAPVSAERAPSTAAGLFAPCRFRSVSSVAYRFAMVAAGEGDFALSLHGTNYWDVAGSHALLRAAGGDLFDDRLQPLRYPADGTGRCGTAVFAGARRFVEGYAGRPFSRKPPPALAPRPVVRRVREAGLLRRAQGLMLGLVAGDSLGALVEFQQNPKPVRDLVDGGVWNLLAGQPTDDSEMALALARMLIARRRFSPTLALQAYQGWLETGPFDAGHTTRAGLQGVPNPHSQSNGSLMRIAPMAIFAQPEEAGALAARDAALTHPHPVCLAATSVYASAASFAVHRGGTAGATFRHALETAAALGVPPEVFEALQRAEYEPPADYYSQMGWVLVAFQNAFHQLLHAPSAEAAIIDTVAKGGDTDTNAAVCGALVGAVHGRESIPVRWQRAILSCRSPRPEACWPADVFTLAEQLLTAHGESRPEPAERHAGSGL